ncbi:hypothetical protein CQW23_29189 [Capsicum baccatum]|uniref:FF domain-containing protein n=1 Tax=Capsicum baccatum TaxID=33114 RepID=A0A2G2VIQ8_CAPBA|nr:hypothetical protein CQW23_29189 [Capsicum baccatum]
MIETVEMKNFSEPASPAVANFSEPALPLEAKSAFKTLLESANIGSDCTWDQAMRAVINDRRYGALKSLGERKQAFNEYLSQKKKLEVEERRVKQKKTREDFRIMLEDYKELSPSSRWSKAISILEHDERFKAVERAKDREDLFEDYVEELEKKHTKALEEQKRNRVEYLEFLKSRDFIKASSQWRKVQDRLETDENAPALRKSIAWRFYSEEEEQRKLRMEELRKDERKNRDEFRKLMEEHVAMNIKKFSAYLAVSSNASRSIANDLFIDVMDELEKQVHDYQTDRGVSGLHGLKCSSQPDPGSGRDMIVDRVVYLDDKSQIKDAVRMAEIGLTSAWTLDDFKFVFKELLERAREKEEKETKKRKRLADEFYEFLHASKEITASSKWEDCKSLFGDRQVASFAFIVLELVT